MTQAFVLASGPSLTPEDVERVRVWRSEDYSRVVVVTNTTFRLAPWADWLFCCDGGWLVHYRSEVQENFRGKVVTVSHLARRYGAECVIGAGFTRYLNSGACAASWAISKGAKRVYLLGCDCKASGKIHWHGDHPKELRNATSLGRWPQDFKKLAKDAEKSGVEIINCSRDTALTCFPLVELESALQAA